MCGSEPSNENEASTPPPLVPTPKPPRPGYISSGGKEVGDGNGGSVRAGPKEHGGENSEVTQEKEAESENLTVEEAKDEGKVSSSTTNSAISRKSRLTINRTNPSVSVGTKKYRSGLNIPK